MHIRLATVEDAAAIAQVHVASWQEAYKGLLPTNLLNSLSVERRQTWWEKSLADESGEATTLVCEVKNKIVGFCSFGPSRDTDVDKTVGEIYAIYVRAAHWNKGYGYALISQALEMLKSKGLHRATLWLLEGNNRTKKFYERVGFIGERTSKIEKLGKTTVRERRFNYTFG